MHGSHAASAGSCGLIDGRAGKQAKRKLSLLVLLVINRARLSLQKFATEVKTSVAKGPQGQGDQTKKPAKSTKGKRRA
jgi:hypothetical protein